jgi:hypothetical protein
MDGTRAMSAEFGKVFRCWVAFMLGKTILWVEPVALDHDAVTLDFGNNAGCRDTEAYAITTDHRSLRAWETRDGKSIDKGVGRAGRELFDHGTHPAVRGAKNVETVDFLRGDGDRCPNDFGIACDLCVETIAGFGGKFFGVIEATQMKVRREDNCSYDDWSGEWATTGLIDACDGGETQCREAMLVNKGAGHTEIIVSERVGCHKKYRHQCG